MEAPSNLIKAERRQVRYQEAGSERKGGEEHMQKALAHALVRAHMCTHTFLLTHSFSHRLVSGKKGEGGITKRKREQEGGKWGYMEYKGSRPWIVFEKGSARWRRAGGGEQAAKKDTRGSGRRKMMM